METQELHSELLSSLGEVRSSSTRNCIREESSTEDSEGIGIGSLGLALCGGRSRQLRRDKYGDIHRRDLGREAAQNKGYSPRFLDSNLSFQRQRKSQAVKSRPAIDAKRYTSYHRSLTDE
ncbi:hypothetical protein Salat_2989000 [Sesamum alatum]|uniref:Uncharacterized protein n=1 Tax=Sesamum alatum TaxID=300844 RepID=A0AAE1XI94_9LAMI|nr:hypothetical protein Salat_2989000 [Sesamum alatum]